MVGYFNILQYSPNNVPLDSNLVANMVEFHLFRNLNSRNYILNHLVKTLDLVLTDIDELMVEQGDSLTQNPDPYHPPLLISLRKKLEKENSQLPAPNFCHTGERKFRQGDYDNYTMRSIHRTGMRFTEKKTVMQVLRNLIK